MKGIGGLLLAVLVGTSLSEAQDSPGVYVTDGLVSIQADRVGLGPLLEELDRTVGTNSAVPSELRGYMVSVSISDVAVDRAIRRIFEGHTIDYAVVGGDRIVVLGRSQTIPSRPRVREVSDAAETPGAQPPAFGGFQIPGVLGGASNAGTPTGRGGRGLEQPPGAAPQPAATSTGARPGVGSDHPFGQVPNLRSQSVEVPPRAFMGNTAPRMLDLNEHQESPVVPGADGAPSGIPGQRPNP